MLKLCCRGSKDVNFCPGNILGFVGELYLLSANARLRLWAIMQLALCLLNIFLHFCRGYFICRDHTGKVSR